MLHFLFFRRALDFSLDHCRCCCKDGQLPFVKLLQFKAKNLVVNWFLLQHFCYTGKVLFIDIAAGLQFEFRLLSLTFSDKNCLHLLFRRLFPYSDINLFKRHL